jgi:formylglycine-generating enzyme required for sulfatase activity
MVKIPKGTITMPDPASPDGKRQVKIDSFWMSTTEIPWDVYDIWAFRLDLTEEQRAQGVEAVSRPSKPYGAPDHGFGHQGYAAIHLTHFSATMFCVWLTVKTGKRYRLPTEAEWEYACRAGMVNDTPMTADALKAVAWFKDNSENKTHPVGKKKPNAWGLYDMLGNAAEWCIGMDGKPVACGGSYQDPADKVMPSARKSQTPDWNATDPQFPKSKWWLSDAPFVTFRVVCDQP